MEMIWDNPEAVLLTMRFIGFSGISLLAGTLAYFNELGFSPKIIFAVFIPYIIITTLVGMYMSGRQRHTLLFFLLLFDIICIGATFAGTQQDTFNLSNVLNSLYLVILISASMLNRSSVLILGGVILVTYLCTIPMSTFSVSSFITFEYITQIFIFILFMGLSLAQSHYYTIILTNRHIRAFRQTDQFVFTTAHDLRAPFALIRLLAEKYEKKRPDTIEELREDMETINQNVASASRLLEDLLLIAKEEGSPLQIAPMELPPFIRDLRKQWESALEKKRIQFIYEDADVPLVLCDRQKLKFALDNIISNGIKYNKQGGTLRIWHEVVGDMVETMIEDTGSGISEENIANIFTPYFRENKNKNIPGTGLGLYGAKKFTEQMHGEIRVSSDLSGTTFTVSLPTKY